MDGMEYIFNVVGTKLPQVGVEFVMIGGHAVNHYGYSRATIDVDFMIASSDVVAVCSVMNAAGFSNVSRSENVVFFDNPDIPYRVDFLHVDEATLRTLINGAQRVEYGGQSLLVPRLLDLLAMKLFALKNGSIRRVEKDLPDIVHLVIEHKLDIETDLKPLCDKFADESIYLKLAEQIRGQTDA